MFQSKKGNMILSVIISIALWVYVVGELDPVVRKTYRSIPVALINEQVLTDEGMSVVAVGKTTMSVTISGKRSVLKNIKEKEVVASVDLADAAEGVNKLKISIQVPDGVEVSSQSMIKMGLRVEKLVSAEKKVQVKYTGGFGKGAEPTTVAVDPEKVTVSGAKSLIDRVDHVQATVDAESISGSTSSATSKLIPVDKRGNRVDQVSLSHSEVKVTTEVYRTKDVKLVVRYSGADEGGYSRKLSTAETVKVKGREAYLKNLESIETKNVDLSDITKSKTIKLEPVLPYGTELSSESEDLTAYVEVIRTESIKKITVAADEIIMRNLDEGRNAKTNDAVTVEIRGSKKEISDISKDDIGVFADCSGLGIGRHRVKIKVRCSKHMYAIHAEPDGIVVVIK